jgi:hypothetical protein
VAIIPSSVQFSEFVGRLLERPRPKPPVYLTGVDGRLLSCGTLREVVNDLALAANSMRNPAQREPLDGLIGMLTGLIAEREQGRIGWVFRDD